MAFLSKNPLLPDLKGLSDKCPWLFLDAARGMQELHGFLVVGANRTLNISEADPEAYQRIASFVGTAKGRCFGWIGYDQARAHPLLDLDKQAPVAVPLPIVYWIEPEGILSFKKTSEETQLDWLVRPDEQLAAQMEASLQSTGTAEALALEGKPMAPGVQRRQI